MILPKDFEDYTSKLMGNELYATLKKGLDEEVPASIRINPFKANQYNIIKKHIMDSGAGDNIPWCSEGLYLSERPNFTFDPLLHAGLYYVQEASSMFVCHILQQLIHQPVMMLDLCAAPGGKSTAARTVLPEGSLLFSNEPMKLRASILSENMQKFGHPGVVVTNNYPKDYRKSGLKFDVILADVPCSGEGMFRKDKVAIEEWSVQNVEKCTQLQRSIVEDIWPCLAEGGILIYSTCTFNAHEDEENVNWIADNLGADFIEIETNDEWNITGSLIDNNPVYRFIPGKTRGEGLFVAVLRKHGKHISAFDLQTGNAERKNRKHRRANGGNEMSETLKSKYSSWLHGDFAIAQSMDKVVAIPTLWQAICEKGLKSLHVLHIGVALGEQKGANLIPDTSLALSLAVNPHAFPYVEVDYATAISYLRKEAIKLTENTPLGFVIISYLGHPLGFVKNIGNRANNLYPQEWKIKSTYLPEKPVDVLQIKTNPNSNHED
ncbi:MAG: methyltransferase RsmF C-terminal domain-like protein [Prevotella sp.]|jgi:16S rRNA C967 or C1407 C5-methylase (RsmB/RsmF family)/NOL1/NOP2/fmu family ribosome biogenesis protein